MLAETALPTLWMIAPFGALCGLITSWMLYAWVSKQDPGNERMQEIAGHVQRGAMAYLSRQYKAIALFFVVGVVIFIGLYSAGLIQHWAIICAFVTGGFMSALAGYIGMRTATNASNRTAAAAQNSLNDGLQVAFKGGAVMGVTVVSLALLDNSLWLYVLNSVIKVGDPTVVTSIMVSCGMGASLMALFARVGGGIFTKAADVGADLVGKVEAGIPEDDPRNPATIADNVGDNVGDVAGMGADLYESYYGSIVAAAGLGSAAVYASGGSIEDVMKIATLPAIIAGFGIIISLLCLGFVRTQEGANQASLLKSLHRGVNAASLLIAIVAFIVLKIGGYDLSILWPIVAGLLAGLFIGHYTEFYTSSEYKPTKDLAAQSETGPATIIIGGVALGMRSCARPVLIIAAAILVSYYGVGGADSTLMGLFGVAIAAVGMLSTLGITLATDAYGPIADNAGGNAEMSELPPIVRERTDALDALGNTTAATGKGFAIGSAALTALAFVGAFAMQLRTVLAEKNLYNVVATSADGLTVTALADVLSAVGVSLMNPSFIIGAFLGAMVVFFFSALTMEAVGRAAMDMVKEVRRQFREIAGIMEGKATAEYAKCVDISTAGALREMKAPALLAFLSPIAVGVLLGVGGVMGMLVGGLSCGFLMAIMMSNAGGAWDNAKKYVESGEYKDSSGEVQAKGTESHKAAVVGDTVGDPFKDTSGPALNILIKLMSIVSVVFLPVFIHFSDGFGLISRLFH